MPPSNDEREVALKAIAKNVEAEAMQADPEDQQGVRDFEREQLQQILDRRAELAQVVADRNDALTEAVDLVRDPKAEPDQVAQGYETAARAYWQAKQELEAFEAKPPAVVDRGEVPRGASPGSRSEGRPGARGARTH